MVVDAKVAVSAAVEATDKDEGTEPEALPSKAPAGRRETAESMAASQRDISVSEFFAKNRHLLGFDNPRKALLTAVKEAVDNALDACEEAGILPTSEVDIRQAGRETASGSACRTTGRASSRSRSPRSSASCSTAPSSTGCSSPAASRGSASPPPACTAC